MHRQARNNIVGHTMCAGGIQTLKSHSQWVAVHKDSNNTVIIDVIVDTVGGW